MARLPALDALRGLIMVVMALDHANAFVARAHSPGEFWAGPIPHYASAGAFLTRAVTHLCAPGFFCLMGMGMTLFARQRRTGGWTRARIARHFVLRGLMLVGINLTVENLAWFLGSSEMARWVRRVSLASFLPPWPGGGDLPFLLCGVLTGLGLAMAAGGLIVLWRPYGIALVAIVSLLVTGLGTPPPAEGPVLYSPLVRLLLIPGHTGRWFVVYPVLPWLAPLCLGMLLARHPERLPARALRVGAGLLLIFWLLRASGAPGNLRPPDGSGWIAFMNVTKYPPSAVYLALTLGVDLLLLALLAGPAAPLARVEAVQVLGRTPLFFYLAHLYLYASVGIVLGPSGTGLGPMYPVWLLGVATLVPLCRRYDAFKRGTPPDSAWRLL